MAQVGPSPLKYLSFGTWAQLVPKGGPRSLPLTLDFVAASSYEIDFGIIAATAQMDQPQCLYVDNKDNTQPVTITTDLIGQVIVCPPQRQGFFPLIVASNAPKILVTSVGGTTATLIVLNVPMPAGTWASTKEQPNFNPLGQLIVSDPVLDAAVVSNMMRVLNHVTASQDVAYLRYMATGFTTVSTVAAGNTVIIAGAVDRATAINAIDISLSGDAALAAPGNLTIGLLDNAAVRFGQWTVTLPAAAGTPFISVARVTGVNFVQTAFNTPVQVNLSAALVAGSCKVSISGGRTTVVG